MVGENCGDLVCFCLREDSLRIHEVHKSDFTQLVALSRKPQLLVCQLTIAFL